jgi:hypothetical protein
MRGVLDPRLAGACLVGALLVSGCSSSAGSSSAQRSSASTSSTAPPKAPAAHALDIAAMIKAAGMGCVDATNDPGPHNPDFAEIASCTIGGDNVAISLWASHTSLQKARSDARDAACSVERSKPPSDETYVEGANWSVFPLGTAKAPRIAAATGGTVRTIDCRGWTPPPGYESLPNT